MTAFFLFFFILILIIFFVALNLLGSILSGILRFFGIGSGKRRNSSNKKSSGENPEQTSRQSQEGARRMRKFKNAAEDADFEVMND